MASSLLAEDSGGAKVKGPAQTESGLCYVGASNVHTPAGDLSKVDLRTARDEALGRVDGVLVDPLARRLRYFVVESLGWLKHRYLLPADRPAQVDRDHRTLRLDVDPHELTKCEEFDRGAVREFSDDDLITAIFQSRTA